MMESLYRSYGATDSLRPTVARQLSAHCASLRQHLPWESRSKFEGVKPAVELGGINTERCDWTDMVRAMTRLPAPATYWPGRHYSFICDKPA